MTKLSLYFLLFIPILLGCSGSEEDSSIHLLEEKGASSSPEVIGTSPFSATITLSTKGMEGLEIKESGICYNMTGSPTTRDKVVKNSISQSSTYRLTGLSKSSTYYVRPYYKIGGRTLYGSTVSFNTTESVSIDAHIQAGYFSTIVTIIMKGCPGMSFRGRVYYSKEASMTTKNSMKSSWVEGTDEIDVELELLPQTRYYMIVAGELDGTTYESVKMLTETPSKIIINGHEAVDLGLPSGKLWAICNIGATEPEGQGDNYKWGETSPTEYSNLNIDFNWKEYKHCSWNSKGQLLYLTKYNTDSIYGEVDNKTELELEDDAAHVNWGKGWRIPSVEEWKELMSNCTWDTKASINGKQGYMATGPNGNSVFFPNITKSGPDCSMHYYWARTLGSQIEYYFAPGNFQDSKIGGAMYFISYSMHIFGTYRHSNFPCTRAIYSKQYK